MISFWRLLTLPLFSGFFFFSANLYLTQTANVAMETKLSIINAVTFVQNQTLVDFGFLFETHKQLEMLVMITGWFVLTSTLLLSIGLFKRLGAFGLVLYLLVASFVLNNPFTDWKQLPSFIMNLGMMGGAILFACNPPKRKQVTSKTQQNPVKKEEKEKKE